jgi:hypothetical protein
MQDEPDAPTHTHAVIKRFMHHHNYTIPTWHVKQYFNSINYMVDNEGVQLFIDIIYHMKRHGLAPLPVVTKTYVMNPMIKTNQDWMISLMNIKRDTVDIGLILFDYQAQSIRAWANLHPAKRVVKHNANIIKRHVNGRIALAYQGEDMRCFSTVHATVSREKCMRVINTMVYNHNMPAFRGFMELLIEAHAIPVILL